MTGYNSFKSFNIEMNIYDELINTNFEPFVWKECFPTKETFKKLKKHFCTLKLCHHPLKQTKLSLIQILVLLYLHTLK